VIEDGNFFERGGVNFSHVMGDGMPASATAHRPELAGRRFEAMGVSLVLHPRNPYCPTVHMNVRCFVALAEGKDPVWWFGGGMDLTPYYPFEEDVRHFPSQLQGGGATLGRRGRIRPPQGLVRPLLLPQAPQRAARRGRAVLRRPRRRRQDRFRHRLRPHQGGGRGFLGGYLPIVERRRDIPYGERERDFQAYRRGRYVEFNLVFDRGTLFGLQSGGRTESILMSMPPVVKWRYDWRPEAGDFLPPRDWL
jgi:coproporphyrinogen III oxidase